MSQQKSTSEVVSFTSAGEVLAQAGFKLLDLAPVGKFTMPEIGGLALTVSTNDAGDGIKFFVPATFGLPATGVNTRYGRLQLSSVEGGTQVTFVPAGKALEAVLAGTISAAKLYGVLSCAFALNLGTLATPAGVAVIAACIAVGLVRVKLRLNENKKLEEKAKAKEEEEEKEDEGKDLDVAMEKQKELERQMTYQ